MRDSKLRQYCVLSLVRGWLRPPLQSPPKGRKSKQKNKTGGVFMSSVKQNYKDRYQRKNAVRLCFNDDEFAVVETIAKDKRKSKAAALRDFILDKESKIKKEIQITDKSGVYYELHKIGVNINQIAKKMHTDIDLFLSGNGEQFAYIIDEVIEEIEDLKRRIG